MQKNLRDGGGKSKWGGKPFGGGKGKGKAADKPSSDLVESIALKRKDAMQKGQAPSNKRRRVRGGGTITVGDRDASNGNALASGSGNVMVLAPNVGADADALEAESLDIAEK